MKLKLYRIKETWKVTSWAYVEANSQEDAIMQFENGEGDFEMEHQDADSDWCETHLDTLEEVSP
jgi:hypothetical protein